MALQRPSLDRLGRNLGLAFLRCCRVLLMEHEPYSWNPQFNRWPGNLSDTWLSQEIGNWGSSAENLLNTAVCLLARVKEVEVNSQDPLPSCFSVCICPFRWSTPHFLLCLTTSFKKEEKGWGRDVVGRSWGVVGGGTELLGRPR